MNKHLKSFIITASLISSFGMSARTSFTGLKSFIERSADTWITNAVASLPYEEKLTFINLFADQSVNSIESTIKCVQTIQSNPLLAQATEELQNVMQSIIEKYVDTMQKKFETRLAAPTKEDFEEFYQKLEQKIYELIGYFNSIFYTKLYNHLAQEDAANIVIMFDKDGVIAPEKRTQALPKPSAE